MSTQATKSVVIKYKGEVVHRTTASIHKTTAQIVAWARWKYGTEVTVEVKP